MSKAKDIARLKVLTEMVLDAQLNDLRTKALQRQNTMTKLEGLRAPSPVLSTDAGIAEALAALTFQTWAEVRRGELSQVLARQTAVWLESRESARIAFGKARGFDALSGKIPKKRAIDT